ncbi:hypothetical protein E3Q10_02160 [Wallemia mellicola]|uniref:C2H2-type domain-containing protein n=1 Tax=Wallemia mellicola TaxID=1708541 RepID=A0A4T0N8S2_9BASI|nr:hypothetical protein E3Q19_02076 [Wallemia mellicola]TIC30407.1 hypothetical protein E3Q10_02160 [Wallemia mellicola]TIC73971.1 hypothetical protein E3Q00_02450 [Wallemia mellicola]
MYKCEICHGRFSRPENMMRHKRNSHRSGDLHPYLCSCGRSYTRSDILLRHQRGCEVHNNGGKPLPGVTTANLKKRGRKPKAVHQPSHSAPPDVTDPSYLAGVAAAATQQQQQQHQQGVALEDWGTVASFDSDPGLDSAYWNCPLYSNSSTPGTEFDAYPGIPLYENGNHSNQQIPQENTSSSDWNNFFQQHNQQQQYHQQQQQTNESFSAWLNK